jgi:hypothetical protein
METPLHAKEYVVSVSTNDIHEAIRLLASNLYSYVEEALILHEDHDSEECEFEVFARDLLGVLMRHAEQLSSEDTDSAEAT